MVTFPQYDPEPGCVALAVAIQGQRPFIASVSTDRHASVLKDVEQAFHLKRADRTDKEAQVRLREMLYTAAYHNGVEDDAARLAAAIYWLAINHYAQGEAVKDQLSSLLAQHGTAVISVGVVGDKEAMRWGFAVGSRPADFSSIMPLDTGAQPFVVSLSPKELRTLN